jgi:hypothetical protein
MLIRVGIPGSFPRFCAQAANLGAAILVSANAFWRDGRFHPPQHDFAGLDVALDSAGFVAMFRYWGYRWSLGEYVDLAAAMRPTWWAAPDYCCEPEIAHDRAEVLDRVTRTAFKLDWCRQVAADRGVPPPMPVLQGWFPEDYLRCADMTPDLPELVGVGSVCRRPLGGPAGLLRVVAALDKRLPSHVLLHLFGAKGAAIAALAGHPRIASMDSQAWDAASRMSTGNTTGRVVVSNTIARRSEHMSRWYEVQRAGLGLFARGLRPEETVNALRKDARPPG